METPPPRESFFRRILLSVLLIAVMAAGVARLPQLLVAESGVKEAAGSYLDATLGRAAALFLSGRVLNGIISVIQGTQVSVGVGVGGQIAVGEALDPLNDIVEQFSTVMLACVVSLGLQKLFLDIGLWFGLSLLLPAAAVVLAVGLWLPGGAVFRVGRRLLAVALIAAFAVPAVSLASGYVTQRFAGEASLRAEAEVRRLSQQIEPAQPAPTNPAERGFWGRLLGGVDLPSLNLEQMQKSYDTLIHTNVDSLIELIEIFVLQTILLPLGSLWLGLRLLRSAAP